MANEQVIAQARVDIAADMGKLDAALAAMPGLVGKAMLQASAKANILTNEIDKQKVALQALATTLKAAGVTKLGSDPGIVTHITKIKELRSELARTRNAQVELARESTAIAGGLGRVGASGGNAAYGLLRLSQAIEDAQYGFGAIVNNIPGIVQALGGGAGLAGAVSIAAVAANQLVNNWSKLTTEVDPTTLMGQSVLSLRRHWEDLKKSFGDTSPIGVAMKKIEDFTNSLVLNAKHEAELARINEEHKHATEEVHGIKDKGASERGTGVREAIEAVGGGEKVLDMFMAKLQDSEKLSQKAKVYIRGQYSKLISEAIKGDGRSLVELMKEARGTALGPKIDEFSAEAKSRHEVSDREYDTAQAQSAINRQKAEEERQRIADKAAAVAEQAGSRLNVSLLDNQPELVRTFKGQLGAMVKAGLLSVEPESGTDRGALKDILQTRLERSGTSKEEAAVIADQAVEVTASKLIEAMKALVVSGQVGNMEEARKHLLKEENLRVGQNQDAQKAALKEQLGLNFKQSQMSVQEYLNRLQTSGGQNNEGLRTAQEANKKLDAIVANTAEWKKMSRGARFGSKKS